MSWPSTPSSPRQAAAPAVAAPDSHVHAPVHADLHSTPVLSNAEQQISPGSPSPSHAHSPPASPRRVKGKRRLKTSPRDREILEDAFRRNPRPNRHDRLEILKELSDAWYEKRVQVWFQNRRQQERRTKQPVVLVREMEPCYGGQVRLVTADSAAPVDSPTLHAAQQPPSGSPSDRPSSQSCTECDTTLDTTFDNTPDTSLASITWEAGASVPEGKADPGQPISRSFAGPVGYCANRLNPARSCSTSSAAPQLAGHASFGPEPSPSSSLSSASAPLPKLPSASSFRLSMSLDGKAEVVPSSSSPPRPVAAPPTPDALPPPAPIDFQGRHSEGRPTLPPFEALTASLPPSPSILSGPLPPRLTRGRSRDVGAWHYVCDPANREDPLTMQAKHESSGSAVAEISLIRSTSSVSSTATSSSSSQQHSASAKRHSAGGHAPSRVDAAKRPRLSRSASSMPRIEMTPTTTLGPSQRHNYLARPAMGLEKSKPGSSTTYVSFAAAGTDSDKENWDPDERFGPRPGGGGGHRRPLPSGPSAALNKLSNSHNNRRRTLDPARSSPFLSNRANTAPAAKGHPDQRHPRGRHHHHHRAGSPPLEIFEDVENGSGSSSGPASDEVARFMSGDVSPSKKGDVDAVAGLLSLSQGNWR